MDEKFYKIKGYEDYLITKTGKIFSILTNKYLKPDTSCRGYHKVKLMDRRLGKFITLQVHRLVGIQFIPNPNNLPEINHKDGNHGNNSVYNLEWCTSEYNKRHALENNLYKIEEDSPRAKLTKEQVIEIHKLFNTFKYSKTKLGRMFNVSDAIIGEILRGVRWSRTYEEIYGKKSLYKKPQRKRVLKDQYKNIIYDYFVNKLTTVALEKKYHITNAYIGKMVRGIVYPNRLNRVLKEIQKSLDNQQPSPTIIRKGSTTKECSSLQDDDIV